MHLDKQIEIQEIWKAQWLYALGNAILFHCIFFECLDYIIFFFF